MLKPFSGEKNSKSLRKKPPFLGPISGPKMAVFGENGGPNLRFWFRDP